MEQLGDVRGAVVWDLYGGIGDTAVLLADRGAQVVSVDADEKAVDWARRRPVPAPVRFIAGKAEDVLPTLPEPNAVVVNPPRAGLHWNVTLRLSAGWATGISCASTTPSCVSPHSSQRAPSELPATAMHAASPSGVGVTLQ